MNQYDLRVYVQLVLFVVGVAAAIGGLAIFTNVRNYSGTIGQVLYVARYGLFAFSALLALLLWYL